MKKIAFFDFDRTLYDGYITMPFGEFLAKKKLVPEEVTEKGFAMYDLFKKGKISYRKLCEDVVFLVGEAIAGKDESTVASWCEMFFKENDLLFAWSRELVGRLKKQGYETYVISGAISPFADLISRELGMDKCFFSEFEIRDGKYTGKTLRVINFEEKGAINESIIEKNGEVFSIAFGDSSGDKEMLLAADEAFLYEPFEDEMAKFAKEKGWNLVDRDNILEVVEEKIQKA